MNEYRFDYHLHPNLPRNEKNAIRKCKLWWKKLKEKKISAVLVSEHVYKNPKRAFSLMKQTQPEGIQCFPAMEYLTREGIDIVIFSNSESIYKHKELTPYNMTLEETVKFVEKKKLFTFITHPYVPSKTGIVSNLGEDAFHEYIKKVRAVEITSVDGMKTLSAFLRKIDFFPIKGFVNKKINQAKNTLNLPKRDYNLKKLKFIAVGSDAHQIEEVGNCLIMKDNKKDLFELMISSVDGEVFISQKNFSLKALISSSLIVFSEYLIKQKYRFLIKFK